MTHSIITTEKLSKSYGDASVLQDVDLDIAPGKLVGFLGPNGAGKTTTIRILMGLLKPTSGNACMFGVPLGRNAPELRRRVGYLPGDVHLYSNLSGRRSLNFLARARRKDCRKQIERLADVFELPLNQNVRSYSTGMKQKLGLIQAMMHEPELLILDEPTSALDPLVRQNVFSELRDVIDAGRSVLFSSHSLNEVEELCDEVIILRRGKVVEHQTIDVLRGRALRRVEISFTNKMVMPCEFPPELQIVEQNSMNLKCTWAGTTAALLNWLNPFALDDLIIERPDLNDLFITYYSDSD